MTSTADATVPAPDGPARYHHGDLPAALMDAVGRLIDRGGLGAVSLRAAAREVGVSHAAPAHHFGDKRGMLTAYACQGYERFSAQLATAWAGADDAATGLRAIGRAYVRFAREHRAHYEVMFRPELLDDEQIADLSETTDAFGVLCAAVAANLPERAPDDPRVLQLAVAAWCTVHGLVQLWFDGPLQHMQGGWGADEDRAAWGLDALEEVCASVVSAALDAERAGGTAA